MANPTKGPGALTLAMALLSAEARKIPCTEATMAEGRTF